MRVRPLAAAQLIAAHETGARAGPHAQSSAPRQRSAPPGDRRFGRQAVAGLTKAQASERIDALQQQMGRGA